MDWNLASILLESGFDLFDALKAASRAKKINFSHSLLEKTFEDETVKRKNSSKQTLLHPFCDFSDDLSSKPWKRIIDNPKDTDSFGNSAPLCC